MKKRVISIVLAIVMVAALIPAAALLTEPTAYAAVSSNYFYNQLNARAKAIYDKLLEAYSGASKADYYTGIKSIDLMGLEYLGGTVDQTTAAEYRAGNKNLFNDFAAAKDALDLDHSELWYLDSSYMSFRLTYDANGYHFLIGPGRGDTFLLAGDEMDAWTVRDMDAEVESIISSIVNKAVKEASAAADYEYTEADRQAALVRSVHDQIVRMISYRYESECKSGNEKYIRTLYALVTHEGVCEAYARALQVCLTRLGIECVLVHGLQTKGTPEDHMWNEVKIDGKWYAVDATWDDPLTADYFGRRELIDVATSHGEDGKESSVYLLVGQSIIGEYWRPSGIVSADGFEFNYPQIETASFNGSTAFQDENGLKVDYSAGAGSMEGVPAGLFTVTFQGMNMKDAADKGFYFLIKMYDYHGDGTKHVMDEWYYANAAMIFLCKNEYFKDTPNGLQIYTATCEYVDVAVTTVKPRNYDNWLSIKDWGEHWQDCYFNGSESDIIAESGMLYNAKSDYEAPPYVSRQTPAANCQATAGYKYRVNVTWDDELYHPIDSTPVPESSKLGDFDNAKAHNVALRLTTVQQDLHSGADITVKLSGDIEADNNKDGYIDMDGTYTDFKWHYVYTSETCPNKEYHQNGHVACDVDAGCRVNGVEFYFEASKMWADDITEYVFNLEGLVGSRSNKHPNEFSFVAAVPGLCPACYRSQGIDWNLWGKPTLLDSPEDLDLYAMAQAGGTDEETLRELQKQMNTRDLNGRLMLVVEDNSKGAGSREKYEEVNGALENALNINDSDIASSSVFEINFNRVCPAVKLQPGQSLRVQVGYPTGVTYEQLVGDDPNVVLKAYHFTRCDEVVNDDCPNKNKAGHKWGDDILSVEEIKLIPNPYGIVVMCDAFSPIEIVALNTSSPAVEKVVNDSNISYDGQRVITVVSDENGTVLAGNAKTVGAAANVSFANRENKIFTVIPKDGYVVDTVTLGGYDKPITVSEDGTFTLTEGQEVTENEVLSVTFLPESVKERDEANHAATAGATACDHKETYIQGAAHAYCTRDGATGNVVCSTCHQIVSHSTVIPATGHVVDHTTEIATVDPTCTKDGYHAYAECQVCGEIISRGGVIPAIGHTFAVEVIKEATCVSTGVDKLTCKLCGVVEVDETPATGAHQYKDGKCVVCGKDDPDYRPWVNTFPDVAKDAWYMKELKFVASRGIFKGDDEGKFNPGGTTTRGQLMTILARICGVNTDPVNLTDPWYKQGMTWAMQMDISDGSDPEGPVTREQFVTMLYRLCLKKVPGIDASGSLSGFTDRDSVSEYAIDAMRWATRNGIMSGIVDETGTYYLNPQGTTNREQAAALIARLCEKYGLVD